MPGIVLGDFRNTLMRAFPDVPALGHLPVLPADAEAALLGWIAERWVAGPGAAPEQVSAFARLRNTVSGVALWVRGIPQALSAEVARIVERVAREVPVAAIDGGGGDYGEGPPEMPTATPDRDPPAARLSKGLRANIRTVSRARGAQDVLQSGLSGDALGAHLAALNERVQADDPHPEYAEPMDAVHASIEHHVRQEVAVRQLGWRENSILAMTAIMTVCAIYMAADVYYDDRLPDPQGSFEPVVEYALPAPPVVLTTPLGAPRMTLQRLVEAEVFNTLEGEKKGLAVRAQPREASDRLHALPEGTRVHVIQHGTLGSGYSKVRYKDATGAYATGWVLTEKLRRVD